MHPEPVEGAIVPGKQCLLLGSRQFVIGRDALRRIEKGEPFDPIVCDIMMSVIVLMVELVAVWEMVLGAKWITGLW